MATAQATSSSKSSAKSKATNGAAPPPVVEEEEAAPSSAKLRFKSTMAREEAAAYFEALVKGLKKGSIHFKQGDESVDLDLASFIKVDVKASRKGSRETVAFELSWRTDDGSELTIIPG